MLWYPLIISRVALNENENSTRSIGTCWPQLWSSPLGTGRSLAKKLLNLGISASCSYVVSRFRSIPHLSSSVGNHVISSSRRLLPYHPWLWENQFGSDDILSAWTVHRRAKLTPAMQKVPKIDTLDALGDAIFYNLDNNLDKVNNCLARYSPCATTTN